MQQIEQTPPGGGDQTAEPPTAVEPTPIGSVDVKPAPTAGTDWRDRKSDFYPIEINFEHDAPARRREWIRATLPPGSVPADVRVVKTKSRGFIGVVAGDLGLAGTIVDFATDLPAHSVVTDGVVLTTDPPPAFQVAPGLDLTKLPVWPVVVKRDGADADRDGDVTELKLHRIDPATLQVIPVAEGASFEELGEILAGKAPARGHCSAATLTVMLQARIEGTMLLWQQIVRVHSLQFPVPLESRVICSDPTNESRNEEIEGLFFESESPFTCHFGSWTGLGPMSRGPMLSDTVSKAKAHLAHILPGAEPSDTPVQVYVRPVLGRCRIGDSTAPIKIDGYVLPLPADFEDPATDESMESKLDRLKQQHPVIAEQLFAAAWGPAAALCGAKAWDNRLLALERVAELPLNVSEEQAHRILGTQWQAFRQECRLDEWRPSNVFRPRPMGARGSVGGTGGQEHFGAMQGSEAISARRPLHAFRCLRASTFHLRPGKFYEADGTLVTIDRHPTWVVWSNQLWHVNPSDNWSPTSDTLGKPRMKDGRLEHADAHGWDGADDQHAGALPAQFAAVALGSPMLQLEAQERIECARARYEDSSDRGRGRLALQLANDALITGDRRAADELFETIDHARKQWVKRDGPVSNLQIIVDPRGLRESNTSTVPVPCTYGWQAGLGGKGALAAVSVLWRFGGYSTELPGLEHWALEYTRSCVAHYEFDSNGRPVSLDQLRFDGSGSELPDDEFRGIGSFHPVYHTTGWFDGDWSYGGVLAHLHLAAGLGHNDEFVERAKRIARYFGVPKTFDEADWRALGPRSLPPLPTSS